MSKIGISKTFAVNALVLSCSVICSILLAEWVCRRIGNQDIYHSKIWHGFNKQIGFFVPDATLGYRPSEARLAAAGGRFGYQNGAKYKNLEDERYVDIAVLGDSLVQSRDSEPVLNRLLGKQRFRPWNIGVGGYNTLQEAMYLEERITRVPDHLVLVYCYNDTYKSMAIRPFGDHQKFAGHRFEPLAYVFPSLFNYSFLYRRLVTSYVKLSQGLRDPLSLDRSSVRLGLRKLNSYAQKNLISFSVIVMPHGRRIQPNSWDQRSRDFIIHTLNEMNIPYVDMYPEFAQYDLKKLFRKNDRVHPNRLGHFLGHKRLLLTHSHLFGLTPKEVKRVRRATFPGQESLLAHSH